MDQLSYILYNTNHVKVDHTLIEQLTQQDLDASHSLEHTHHNAPYILTQESNMQIVSLLHDKVSKLEQRQTQRRHLYEKTVQALYEELNQTSASLVSQGEQITTIRKQLIKSKTMLLQLSNLVKPPQMNRLGSPGSRDYMGLSPMPHKMNLKYKDAV